MNMLLQIFHSGRIGHPSMRVSVIRKVVYVGWVHAFVTVTLGGTNAES